MMNSKQLTFALEHHLCTSTYFKAVLPCDLLPTCLPSCLPALYIVNTDPSTKQGQHWVLVFISKQQTGYFFDSYRLPPEFWDHRLYTFFNHNKLSINYNHIQLQSINSTLCGEWCLFISHFLCKNYKTVIYKTESERKVSQNELVQKEQFMLRWTEKHFSLTITKFKHTLTSSKSQFCIKLLDALRYK